LNAKLGEANDEYKETRKIYDQSANAGDLSTRLSTAKRMREEMTETAANLDSAVAILSKFASQGKKAELETEVWYERVRFLLQ